MSSLTGTSTTEEVRVAYDNSASYVEDNSIVKARLFITAIRILIRRSASTMAKGSNAVGIPVYLLSDQLREAQIWLEARDPNSRAGPDVTRADFRNFREGG